MYCFSVDVKSNNCGGYDLSFPAFEGMTCTPDMEMGNVMTYANEYLSLQVVEYLETCRMLPKDGFGVYPTKDGWERVYVTVSGDPKVEMKLVKKTLTIPEWLNAAGEENGVNFSSLLTKALKSELYGVKDASAN